MREITTVKPGEEGAETIEKQQKAAERMLNIRYIDRDNAVFTATGGGFVRMEMGEETCERIAVHRCFPFTQPEQFLSIRDEEQNELGLVRSLSDLSEEAAALLREQMDLRYFLPQIIKVNSIKDEYGYSYWDVVTDKGGCRFTCRTGGNTVAKPSENRLMVTDINGNRFELADITKLTPKEMKMIDLYI